MVGRCFRLGLNKVRAEVGRPRRLSWTADRAMLGTTKYGFSKSLDVTELQVVRQDFGGNWKLEAVSHGSINSSKYCGVTIGVVPPIYACGGISAALAASHYCLRVWACKLGRANEVSTQSVLQRRKGPRQRR